MKTQNTANRNKGGRPVGSADPLSIRSRKRMLKELARRAAEGDAEAARVLLTVGDQTRKQRTAS